MAETIEAYGLEFRGLHGLLGATPGSPHDYVSIVIPTLDVLRASEAPPRVVVCTGVTGALGAGLYHAGIVFRPVGRQTVAIRRVSAFLFNTADAYTPIVAHRTLDAASLSVSPGGVVADDLAAEVESTGLATTLTSPDLVGLQTAHVLLDDLATGASPRTLRWEARGSPILLRGQADGGGIERLQFHWSRTAALNDDDTAIVCIEYVTGPLDVIPAA